MKPRRKRTHENNQQVRSQEDAVNGIRHFPVNIGMRRN
jgi:hypothetical protein